MSDEQKYPGSEMKDGIEVHSNKPAEEYTAEIEEKYIVPDLIREQFPSLIKMIYETESMNAEEREYWLQIMPIMTEEQIVKLKDILVKEKTQLAALEQEAQTSGGTKTVDLAAKRAEREKLLQAEAAEEKEEEMAEANLLEQLNNL